jgi:hypothetical protein
VKTIIRFFGGCVVQIVMTIAFWSGAFALCVRGCSTIAPDQPSLSSFDPNQRVAAAEAAARKYGVKP